MSEQNNSQPDLSVSKEELFELVVTLDIKKFRCKICKAPRTSKKEFWITYIEITSKRHVLTKFYGQSGGCCCCCFSSGCLKNLQNEKLFLYLSGHKNSFLKKLNPFSGINSQP